MKCAHCGKEIPKFKLKVVRKHHVVQDETGEYEFVASDFLPRGSRQYALPPRLVYVAKVDHETSLQEPQDQTGG